MALFDPAAARLFSQLGSAAPRLTRIHRWDADDDRAIGSHLHAVPILYVCLAGTARLTGGRRGRIDLAAGEGVALAPGVRHAHHPLRAGSVALDLGFIAEACDFDLRDKDLALWCRIRAQPYREWCDALLAADVAGRLELARRIIAGVAEERIEAMGFPHPAQRAMADRLWRNDSGLDAAAILDASGLGRRRAHALFREFFRTTPKQALLDQRLALARTFLAAGHGIAETATRSGFGDRADLTRAWRRAFGAPPSAVRGRGAGRPTGS